MNLQNVRPIFSHSYRNKNIKITKWVKRKKKRMNIAARLIALLYMGTKQQAPALVFVTPMAGIQWQDQQS